jgi:hypothetical protein
MTNAVEQVEMPAAAVRLTTAPSLCSLDILGIVVSSICLVHCLALPFLLTFLPLVGWQFLEGKLAHQILAIFVLSFALFGILPGYLKHQKINILVGMIFGLGAILVATLLCDSLLPEAVELPLITVGNLTLVFTHWNNRHSLSCDHINC